MTQPITVLDALVQALERAGLYNRNAEIGPIAILWPDGARQWERVVPILRDTHKLPILTLGDYDPQHPEAKTGPAIWVRAELASTSADASTSEGTASGQLPIVYLPGIRKDVFRAVEDAPAEIQPLLFLQFRGTLFLQPNGKDWTLPAFFQNAQHGLGITVDTSEATKSALVSTAPQLLSRSLTDLRNHAGGIDVEYLASILIPDPVRRILEWIDDPETTRAGLDDAVWDVFRKQLKDKYQLDPERDGVLEGARRLGEAKAGTNWDAVWARFAEAPSSYPHIPDRLRAARPSGKQQRTLFEAAVSYHWPQENEEEETQLRHALLALDDMTDKEARAKLVDLNQIHAARRSCIWARLGQSPLAFALEQLAFIAEKTTNAFPAGSVATMQAAYTDWGWQIDAKAIEVGVDLSIADRQAIDAALHAIYTPWLWTTAQNFQHAIADEKLPTMPTPRTAQPGTCVLFADGLRYDLGSRLVEKILQAGGKAEIAGGIGPLPGVTPSAKPAQSPIAHRLQAGSSLNAVATGTTLSIDAFRKLLKDEGWQVLQNDEVGSPDSQALAWTEFGNIDKQGHADPGGLPQQAAQEIERIRQRIAALIYAGWSRVEVITDHGWLLTPRPMKKSDLPISVVIERKGRCARLKDGAAVTVQTIPWIWDGNVRIAIAPAISCFEDGKRYEHGGVSLQECIVPTITVSGAAPAPRVAVGFSTVVWRGLRCVVELDGASAGTSIDIRQKANDPATSLVAQPGIVDESGNTRVLIEDNANETLAAVIVVLDNAGTVLAQRQTIVGGDA